MPEAAASPGRAKAGMGCNALVLLGSSPGAAGCRDSSEGRGAACTSRWDGWYGGGHLGTHGASRLSCHTSAHGTQGKARDARSQDGAPHHPSSSRLAGGPGHRCNYCHLRGHFLRQHPPAPPQPGLPGTHGRRVAGWHAAALPPPLTHSPPPFPPEAAPAAALRAAPAARHPAADAAARCGTAAGGPRLHQPPRGGCSAAPPRPGTCPWKITASPPAPPPGRADPVPAAPPSPVQRRAAPLQPLRPRAPPVPRRRAGRATDARPPRISLPPPAWRGAAPGAVPGVSPCAAPDVPGSAAPELLAAPLSCPVRHLPPTPRPGAPAAAGRAGHPVPAEVCAPYRAHATAGPLPPRRVGPWGRRTASPDPLPVPMPCQARSRRRRCCRVNESLEVGGGWRRLSPPAPRSALRAAALPSAPLRYPHRHRGRGHRRALAGA